MSRLEIDKQRFKSFLDQFIGDAPYQVELVKKILNDMPEQVAKQLIEELYYQNVYDGPLFVAQHAVFKDDIHFFPNFESLTIFLNDINKFSREFNTDSLLAIDKKFIQKRMKEQLPLCGYLITMERVKDDDNEQPRREQQTRYSQFQ